MPATHMYAGIPANMDIKVVPGYRFDNFTFENLRSFLASAPGGSVDARLLASNVMVSVSYFDADMREPEAIDIVLYDTPIVRYYSDGTFSVDNGGYNTLTTARRITQFSPNGYWFGHQHKKLVGAGKGECTHAVRFPVEREPMGGAGWPE